MKIVYTRKPLVNYFITDLMTRTNIEQRVHLVGICKHDSFRIVKSWKRDEVGLHFGSEVWVDRSCFTHLKHEVHFNSKKTEHVSFDRIS